MQYNDLVAFAKVCKLATCGDVVITATTPKMPKRNNPYFGRVTRLTYASNVSVQHYGRPLEQHIADAQGCARKDVNYEYDLNRCVKGWRVKPIITDNDQFVYYYRVNSTIWYAYMVDGVLVDAETAKTIEAICTDSTAFSDNPKQLAEGIARNKQVWTKRPKCCNVRYYANCDNYFGLDDLKETIKSKGVKHTFATDLGEDA